MVNTAEREQRLRKLHRLLCHPKRSFYVRGVQTLWDLSTRKLWILKTDFLNDLTNRLQNDPELEEFYESDGTLKEGNEKEPDWDDVGEYEEAESEEDDIPEGDDKSPRRVANDIFKYMRDTGWFVVIRESLETGSAVTLRIPEEACRLAAYVVKDEIKQTYDTSACLYPVYATLKQANAEYDSLKNSATPAPGSVRAEAGKDMLHALQLADEKQSLLHERLSISLNAFRGLIEQIASCRDPETLLSITEDEFGEKQLARVLRPLRIDDGIDRYSGQITTLIDGWIVDEDAQRLLSEAARADGKGEGEERTATRTIATLYAVRYEYGSEIKKFWDYLQELEGIATEKIKKKYQILAGNFSSLEGDITRILAQLGGLDEMVQYAAERAAQEAFRPFLCEAPQEGSLSTPKARYRPDPQRAAVVSTTTQLKAADKGELLKNSVFSEVARRMSESIAANGGRMDNESLPLNSREDRVFQMVAVLASNAGLTDYRVASIDDGRRIEGRGQAVPFVLFETISDEGGGC